MRLEMADQDSYSVGDPSRFLSLEHLERGLASLPGTPKNEGQVTLIIQRGEAGRREKLDRVLVSPEEGLRGDAWGRQKNPNPAAQIAVMQTHVATLIANGQPLTLFGDNLFLDLDLSVSNLPPGSQVRIGNATLEVTPKPHTGCSKFRARFGADALRFTAKPELRHLNLRGIFMRVLQPGEVAIGDRVEVLTLPPWNPVIKSCR